MTIPPKLRGTAIAFALALSIGAVAPSVVPTAAQARVKSVSAGLGASHDAFCASMADQINHAAGTGDALFAQGSSGAESWWQYARDLRTVAEAGGCRFTGIARTQTATGGRRVQTAAGGTQLNLAPANPWRAAKAAAGRTRSLYGLAG